MIAINFRWPTPSTVLKNSDPPPYFPQPTPPFTLWLVPNATKLLCFTYILYIITTSIYHSVNIFNITEFWKTLFPTFKH
jgi:hypothetical protein